MACARKLRAASLLSVQMAAKPNSRTVSSLRAWSGVGCFPGLLNSMKAAIPPGSKNRSSGKPAVTPGRNDNRMWPIPRAFAQRITGVRTLFSGVMGHLLLPAT